MKYSDRCERLSHSEHAARAMLLGRVYDWRDGTYCTSFKDGHLSTANVLDCLTCEPITPAEEHMRKMQGFTGSAWDIPEQPTPWAKLG